MGKLTGDVAQYISDLDERVEATEKALDGVAKVIQEFDKYARDNNQAARAENRRRFCLHEAMNFYRTASGGILSAGAIIALADEFDRYVVHGSEGMPDAAAEKMNTEAMVRAVVDRAYPTRYSKVPQPVTINPGLSGMVTSSTTR